MKRSKRVLLMITGGIIFLALTAILLVNVNFYWRTPKDYAFIPRTVPTSHNADALLQGENLVAVKGCKECHGDDMGGKVMVKDSAVGLIAAPNVTEGADGLSPDYTEAGFVNLKMAKS